MLESTLCRKFQLSHYFAEGIVANPKYIIQKWRNFLFLRYLSIETYLKFFTMISDWEIHVHLYRLFFRLCKTLFYTYVCRAFCAQLERNLGKLKEVYLTNILIYNKLFHCYIYITDLEIKRYHWTPSLQNCWSRMHKERKQLVTWMLHHQLRVGSNSNSPLFHHLSIQNSAKYMQ